MFKNYFKTAWRSLLKNKVTGFINLFGLAIGMTAAVYIFLWVQNESSFDAYHPEKNNIYRITHAIGVSPDETWVWENSPMLMGEEAKKQIPEVEAAARLMSNSWGGPVFSINNQLFSDKSSAWVDSSWFAIFHYDFIKGSAAAFGKDPFTIILTESKAKKFFGSTNVTGKIIRVDTVNYTVQAVVKDNPVNSSFRFDILLHIAGRLSDPKTYKNDKTWNNFNYISFLKLHPGASQSVVETKLNDIINKNRTNHNDKISIVPLSGMYFESNVQNSAFPHGSKKTSQVFSLLGILLLLIACINYVNLTTAKASLRAKEVSVRKIVGAKRLHLFFQFIAESLTISFLAMIVTVLLVKLCLPVFNMITEKNFELSIASASMWKILGSTLLAATLLNGLYPATLLSSFKPLNVFRGKTLLKLNDGTIRRGLVVLQFSLSILLIIGTIVIYRQLNYIQTTNPGYDVSQVMSLQVPYRIYARLKPEEKKDFFSAIRQELLSQSAIASVSTGGSEIVNVESFSSGNADWDGHDTTYNPTIARLSVDVDFKKMFRLEMTAGKWFEPTAEDERNYILNETAVQQLNILQPVIGQRFTWGGDTGRIIGVVKDFHYKSMHEKIGPMALMYQSGGDSYFFIKTVPGNIAKTISVVNTVWTKFIPAEPFSYTFLDESFNNLYKTDIKTSRLIFIFSIIAIIICALGLFGLAAFTAEQRTKEIGIRKVLGATVQQITTLLSVGFLKLVLIALFIATPIAWFVMNKWLEDFAYRTTVSWWIFPAAGMIAILIAFSTVSFQAIKAAIANPVRSLRTE